MRDSSTSISTAELSSANRLPLNFARARLRLGIAYVGTLTTFSALAMIFGFTTTLFPTEEVPIRDEITSVAGFLAIIVCIGIPFDLVGGFFLPRRFKRNPPSFPHFIRKWLRGTLVHTLLLTVFALAILCAGRTAGGRGVLLLVACGSLLLLIVQPYLARLLGGLRSRGQLAQSAEPANKLSEPIIAAKSVAIYEGQDEGYTGGIVGIPGREHIIVPASWLTDLSPSQLEAQVARRTILVRSGSYRRGIIVAAIWNLAGLTVLLGVLGLQVNSVADLVTLSFSMTVWSFLGLLNLPSISRPAVFLADQMAARLGVPRRLLADTMRKIDRSLDDEPSRDPVVETIFHPVPCVNQRLAALDSGHPIGYNAWHAARTALYLSWACMGLLSRAVHCNAGRPELWVMLPCD